MPAPEVSVGQTVAYVPGLAHHLDRDSRDDHVFEFVYAKAGSPGNGKQAVKEGEAALMQHVGQLQHRDSEGHFKTGSGHVIKPSRPKITFPAVVTAVHGDGLVDLDIQHPKGHRLGYTKIPFQTGDALHSWRLPEGA